MENQRRQFRNLQGNHLQELRLQNEPDGWVVRRFENINRNGWSEVMMSGNRFWNSYQEGLEELERRREELVLLGFVRCGEFRH